MGCDIHGYVEVRKYDFGEWYDCIDIQSIVGRNYNMFALLFGIRNYANYIPLTENRGLPEGLSDRAKEKIKYWAEDGHSHSFVTWQELQTINWDEYGTSLSEWIYGYHSPTDQEHFTCFGDSSILTREHHAIMAKGETVEVQGNFYRRKVEKTGDSLSSDWKCLFDLMKVLDEYHRKGDLEANVIESVPAIAKIEDTSKVRLVVWFDN
jgi:hypothetical protein